ncbi:Putative NAD(P)H nitroreductase YdjA [Maioricimonas rarisocia]|uniref:NAD(P)H nitroreductase YdjA n=1 Tax=Maioricimonas rarisocia TaxID=2528026 RepID=A0A517Z620_9PLAN|nr:nitroreductase [Maioricimonas rarisocia]QDU37923.1 Putative NAD(P)H nitroreductase YdjA [Maioricimonas rarisocia]
MQSFTESGSPLAELIRGRRTINLFQPETPPLETVLQAIELARWAPNHKHTEPWRFHLIGPQTAGKIVDLNARLVTEAKGTEAGEAKRARWSAVPGWLAVTCVRSEEELRDEEDYAACCCAIQNLSLHLWEEGIGVKWSTGAVTRDPAFYELLDLDPRERRVVGLLWYGYPASVPEQRRRPVEEIVVELP